MAIIIDSTAQIPIIVPVHSQNDQTAVPEFMLTPETEADPSGTWVAGSWQGTWDSITGHGLEAVSPLTGATDFELTPLDTPQLLWIRWTAGVHVPVFGATLVHVT